MKIGSTIKFDKKNTTTSKKFDDDDILLNYDVIAIFLIYGQFGATRKSDSRRMVYSTNILIKSNLLSYKNCKQN